MRLLTVETYRQERKINTEIANLLKTYLQVSRDFVQSKDNTLRVVELHLDNSNFYAYDYAGLYKESRVEERDPIIYSNIIENTKVFKKYHQFIKGIYSHFNSCWIDEGFGINMGKLYVAIAFKIVGSDGVYDCYNWISDTGNTESQLKQWFNKKIGFYKYGINTDINIKKYQRRACSGSITDKPYINLDLEGITNTNFLSYYILNLYLSDWQGKVKSWIIDNFENGLKKVNFDVKLSIDDKREVKQASYDDLHGNIIYESKIIPERTKKENNDLLKYLTALTLTGGLKWMLK